MTRYPRLSAVGDAAISVELGAGVGPEQSARVRGLDLGLRERPLTGVRESVPAYASLLVLYDPAAVSFEELGRELLARASVPRLDAPPGRLLRIPTLYGGEGGPDLEALARARGLTPGDAIALHAGREYTALMLGFLPGFAYLGMLDERLEAPRRATPRVRVEAGSVAIAGRQTGIYPAASPGGWSLIGRTARRLFDPLAEQPALILPGDRVRFVPVAELPAAGPVAASAGGGVEPAGARTGAGGLTAIEVAEPGLCTSVQDLGRTGYRRLGVGLAGAADRAALAAANLAVGNPPGAAGLECTLVGPRLVFLRATRFALAGGDLGAVLLRRDLGEWRVPFATSVLARPGSQLRFGARRSGCRAYLAFAGGIAVAPVLGSRATDLTSGFGGLQGRALRAGDSLALEGVRTRPADARAQACEPAPDICQVRVVLGPQADQFDGDALASFLGATWSVSQASDRVGCRLAGPRIAHLGAGEIVSEGMLPGSIQLPPDGQPIVMLADGPTSGGYPKIATAIGADLGRLGQLAPGESRVRFTAVSVAEAQAARPPGLAEPGSPWQEASP